MISSRKVGNQFGYSKKDTKENLGSCNNMEELLNKLIEKGWKPFGITCTDFIKGTGLECIPSYCFNPHPHMWFPWWTRKYHRPSLRQIASKESWLWQFCIANHLLKKYSDLWDDDEYIIWRWQNWMDWKTTDWEYIDENYDSDIYHQDESYQRWLIESSLKDESELEDFLLNSIKID